MRFIKAWYLNHHKIDILKLIRSKEHHLRIIKNPAAEVCLPGFEKFHAEFLKSRREELIDLFSALKELNFIILTNQAHRWRGFSAPYGFQELALLSEELEEQALSKNAQSCEEILKRVSDYLGKGD